jgi:inositol 2-dehydrogenase
MSSPVRMGVVGLGRIGRFHAENIGGRIASIELVRVVDHKEEAARSTGERLGVAWSTSYGDLLGDPAIEAVAIVTPTGLHADMIERAVVAGKHVFCEKPIALERAATERVIRAAREAGMKLQVGFQRRFHPDWASTTARIRAGELGEVRFFRTSQRDMRPPALEFLRTSGGIFLDMMIHDFDAARWMVGEVEEVTAFGASPADPSIGEIGDADLAVVTLRFASGALGVIDNSRAAGYGYECSTEVVGSKASARIAYDRRTNVAWLTPGAATMDVVSDFMERFRPAYLLELEAFADAVRNDRPVPVAGEDALAAFILSEAATRSFRERRTVRLRQLERGGVTTPEIVSEVG